MLRFLSHWVEFQNQQQTSHAVLQNCLVDWFSCLSPRTSQWRMAKGQALNATGETHPSHSAFSPCQKHAGKLPLKSCISFLDCNTMCAGLWPPVTGHHNCSVKIADVNVSMRPKRGYCDYQWHHVFLQTLFAYLCPMSLVPGMRYHNQSEQAFWDLLNSLFSMVTFLHLPLSERICPDYTYVKPGEVTHSKTAFSSVWSLAVGLISCLKFYCISKMTFESFIWKWGLAMVVKHTCYMLLPGLTHFNDKRELQANKSYMPLASTKWPWSLFPCYWIIKL